MNLGEILRGVGGDLEISRVLGAAGTLVYIVGANAFLAWDMWRGHPFDVTAYCLAFPGGLGAAVAAIAGAAAYKDRTFVRAMQDRGEASLTDIPENLK